MPRKRIDKRKAAYDLQFTQIWFKAMQEQPQINADVIWEYARRELIPPVEVTSRMAASFRRYIGAFYLKRTGRFVLSSRNDSSPLPQYVSTIYKGSSKAVPEILGEMGAKEHGVETKG